MKRQRKYWTYASMSGAALLIIFAVYKYRAEKSKVSETKVSQPSVESESTEDLTERGEIPPADKGNRIKVSNKSSRSARGNNYIMHPIMEDLKRFPESFEEALRSDDYGYAGDLLAGTACVNAPKDPVADSDCLPLLRREIAREERLFVSDQLAASYLEKEANSDLKKKGLNAIKRVNPNVYDQRGPCLEYDAADKFEEKDRLITICLQKLNEQLEELGEGPFKHHFWKHFEYLGIRSMKDAIRYKSDMNIEFPGISNVPQPPGLAPKKQRN